MAKAHRPFWAREIILAEMMRKIELRKQLRTWSRTLLKETVAKVPQVVIVKGILKNVADRVIEEVGKKKEDEEVTESKDTEREEDEASVTDTGRKRKRMKKGDLEEEPRDKPVGKTRTDDSREKPRPRKVQKEWKKILEGGGDPNQQYGSKERRTEKEEIRERKEERKP